MGKHAEEINAERTSLGMRGLSYEGIRIIQMGDITHKSPEPRMNAKEWYLEQGAKKVVTIDLNGRHGARKLDLGEPLPEELHNRFHLVTNYGTGEHVNNQYMFFKNCHDVCKKGGIIIHQLLHSGFFPEHGRFYYTQKTAFRLAEMCSYSLLYMQNMGSASSGRDGLILVAFLKRSASKFPSPFSFRRVPILDTKDLRRTGDYNKAGFGALSSNKPPADRKGDSEPEK